MKKKQTLAEAYPDIAKQWHPTKNGLLTPHDVAPKSHKKTWWKCPKGDDHEWPAAIANRVSGGTGCPVCAGLKAVLSNCLATTHPKLAEEWHSTKNVTLTPYDVVAGSNMRVWWKCAKGDDHEWQAVIYNRTSAESGCLVCRSLAFTHPELAKQWHPTKNGTQTPRDVVSGSSKKVWWKCPKGDDHEWSAALASRASGNGCSICARQKVSSSNCLAITHPKIARQWHPTKNGELTPYDVLAGSGKKAWWKCPKGDDHEWLAPITERSSGRGCSVCRGLTIVKSNCLANTHPEIAKEWHSINNGRLTPYEITAGYGKIVWWKCAKGSDHEWQTRPIDRKGGAGCPVCAGKKVVTSNCLATKYPELAKEWHPTKNGDLTPDKVTIGSGKKMWWKCLKGDDHEWQASISDRSHGRGCSVCSHRTVVHSNALATTHSQLAKEWHPTKNNDLTPDDVTAGSHQKVWWQCSEDDSHEWPARIEKRVKGRGCPYCNSGWTVENIRFFVSSIKDSLHSLTSAELFVLFQQTGLTTTGKAKPFVEALKTGKFPMEELEKFVDGKPSLVDDIINDPSVNLEGSLEEDISKCQVQDSEIEDKEEEKELPTVETKDILAALDNKVFSSADEEAVEFFIISGCSKIWNHAFKNEEEAVKQAEESDLGEYPTQVKNRFLEEYYSSKKLRIPKGYSFSVDGKVAEPNLMQRLVACRVQKYKRQGNWSGTGAGKTLSAILASRVIDSKLTIICCPNSVVKGWKANLLATYPDSVVHTKTLSPKIEQSDGKNHYLVLNYETFQQETSELLVKKFVEKYQIDFIVIDEIHYSKQRTSENVSRRKTVIAGLISNAGAINPNLHTLGMSATPVINNLYEGKSLLELITSVYYDELGTKPTVSNCIALYQKLASVGIRWMPNYRQKLNLQKIDVDCSDYISDIEELGITHTMLDLEKILTEARLPVIKEHIKPKTLIYTYYVQDICDTLKKEIEKEGWKVAMFTGDDKSGLESFINGDTDVLIGSSAIGTGVDGLQSVCNRLIINILPWTHAEFEQLKGRIYRQGQKEKEVDIIVPLTKAEVNGKDWSWCQSKWKRIQFKKSIADAAVDGVVPEGHLRTPAQAYKDAMQWLKRLEDGEISEIERRKIHIPLSDTTIRKRARKYGDFSKMNQRMNNSNSQTTHERFQKDPKEWEQYHALYREAREDWSVVPYEEMITWCKARPHLVVGDFGCGEAKIAEGLENTVHSFDHIAINESVLACDMANVPLDDETLDVAIFSLSLMGKNFTDYLREAHRTLKLDGNLHIVEATSRFSELDTFLKGLHSLGFDVVSNEERFKFTFIRCIKSERKPRDVELSF